MKLEQELYGEIVQGELIEAWLKSQVGRFVLECKDKVQKRVMEEFRKVDPYDPQAVMLLQRALTAATEAVKWLEDAVIAAKQTEQILTQEEKGIEVIYE